MDFFRQWIARPLARKFLSERKPSLRTESPLPADYDALRRSVDGELGKHHIRIFEEEWKDSYRLYE